MSDTILRLSNVESAYGPITAIRGVSLEVPRGKIVAVLGANGAGKTTILKTTSGVLDPVTGVVTQTQAGVNTMSLQARQIAAQEIRVAIAEQRRARFAIVAEHASLLGPSPAEKRTSRRTTHGILAIGPIEPHALRRQGVEIRRAHDGMAIAAERRVEIVDRDEQHVLARGIGAEGRCEPRHHEQHPKTSP